MHFFKSLLGLILLNGFTAVVVMRDAAARQTDRIMPYLLLLGHTKMQNIKDYNTTLWCLLSVLCVTKALGSFINHVDS